MKVKGFLITVILFVTSIISLGFVQSSCSVCEKSSFLEGYFLKANRAVEDINSQLRQQQLIPWQRSQFLEKMLFPLKYSFSQLMGVVEGWNVYMEASKVAFRDLKGFEKIDGIIKLAEFNILGTNLFWNQVPIDFINRFLASYQNLGVVNIEEILYTASWEDLLNALWAVNFVNKHYRAKSALGEGYQPIVSGEDLINFFNRALGGRVKLSLNDSSISQLQNEYECFVKEYGVCEKGENGEDVYQRIENIVSSFSNQGSQTIEKFILSFNRLKEALQRFNTSGGFWNKNWMKLSTKMKIDNNALVDYNIMAGRQLSFSGADITSRVFEEAQVKKIFGEARVENMPDNLDLIRIIYFSGYGIQDSLNKDQKEIKVAIQQSLEKLDFLLKKSVIQDVAIGTSWEPRVYTIKIVEISKQIHKALDIVGTKDKGDSLIGILGSACELQCANLGGKCWAD